MMAEIKLQKRAVYVTDVYAALVKAGYEDATYFIQGLPSANVAPVRHGTWKRGECSETLFCSECQLSGLPDWDGKPIHSPYCPRCGARMDGGADDEK